MNINFNTGKKVERIEEEEINEVEEVEDDDEQAVKKKVDQSALMNNLMSQLKQRVQGKGKN